MKIRKLVFASGKMALAAAAIPLAWAFISFSAKKDPGSRLDPGHYSGRQLFSAVYLQDSLSAAFSTLQTVTRKSSAKLNARQASVYAFLLDSIEHRDPAFFNHFKEELVSGDHMRVRQIIESSQAMLAELIHGLNGKPVRAAADESEPYSPIIFIFPATTPYPDRIPTIVECVILYCYVVVVGPESSGELAVSKFGKDRFFTETFIEELVNKFGS